MAPRAIWKGVLTVSLVSIPIKVFPATESSAKLEFNQLHEACQSRMQQRRWCPTCAREVKADEIVKGFEFEQGKFVLLLEAELDAVQPPSTKVIDLVQFADTAALDPMYIDRTYYLAPDGAAAGEAYVVLSQAMNGVVGIGKLAIYGREYLVAIRRQLLGRRQSVLQPTLLLHTLHHDAEIRPCDGLGDVPTFTPVKTDAVRLAGQVIASLTGPLQLAAFTDEYQRDVRRLIDAKIAGDEFVQATAAETAPTLSLQAALEQSLAAVSVRHKPMAKVMPAAKRKRA